MTDTIPTFNADKRLLPRPVAPVPGQRGAFYGSAVTVAKGTGTSTCGAAWHHARAAVGFILTHLPHIIAPLLGIAFLARFAVYVRRLPPAHLSDEELAEWHAQRSGDRAPAASDASEQPLPR
jgi:hypothetical protein